MSSPAAEAAADLLTPPWDAPLSRWTDDRRVQNPQHGRSEHVVRFVAEAGRVFVVEELPEQSARREYEVLRRLPELGNPAVEVIGVVVDAPPSPRTCAAGWTPPRSSARSWSTGGPCPRRPAGRRDAGGGNYVDRGAVPGGWPVTGLTTPTAIQ
nr:hypothetical protein [Geodermatophilus obscurus]